jgi:hypothetical protein
MEGGMAPGLKLKVKTAKQERRRNLRVSAIIAEP